MGIQQSMGYGFGRFLDLEIDAAGLGDAGGGGMGEPAGGAPDTGAVAAPDPYADRFAQYDQRFGGLESQLGQIASMLQGQQAPQEPAALPTQLPEWDPWDPNVVAAYQAQAVREALGPLMEQLAPIQEITAQTAAQRADEIATRELEARAQDPRFGSFDLHTGKMLAEALVVGHGMDDAQAFDLVAQHLATYEKQIHERAFQAGREALQAELSGAANAALNGQPSISGDVGGSASRIAETPTGPDKYAQVLADWRQRRAARAPGS